MTPCYGPDNYMIIEKKGAQLTLQGEAGDTKRRATGAVKRVARRSVDVEEVGDRAPVQAVRRSDRIVKRKTLEM